MTMICWWYRLTRASNVMGVSTLWKRSLPARRLITNGASAVRTVTTCSGSSSALL